MMKDDKTQEKFVEEQKESGKISAIDFALSENSKSLDEKIVEGAPTDIDGDKLLEESVAIAELEKTKETQKPKSKKKSIIISLVFLAINIALVSYIASSLIKSTNASFVSAFAGQGKRLWWFALSFGFLIVGLVADAMTFAILIKKTTGKFRPVLAYKTTAMGRYYEAVTPLSIGMQPGQIVELSKGGITPGVATSIPIMRMIVYNLMNVVLGLVFLIAVSSRIVAASDLAQIFLVVFKVLAYIGVIISGGIIAVIILIANSKMLGRSLARFVVRVGYKLHFVKDYRKAYGKLMNSVLEFQNSMSYFKKNIGTLVGVVVSMVVALLCFASLPFSITLALSDVSFSSFGDGLWFWLECISRFYICYMASSFIPLPGGTGMMEVSFMLMFGSKKDKRFLGNNLVWGFLSWRIISYYLIILQGMVFVVASTTKTIVTARKQVKLQKNKKE